MNGSVEVVDNKAVASDEWRVAREEPEHAAPGVWFDCTKSPLLRPQRAGLRRAGPSPGLVDLHKPQGLGAR